jgi:2-hydroxycyclohexanecarboxyl-CoA dehydrogenase
VEREVGPIEALVNNVGWTQELAFLDPDARSQWEREVQINLWGTINCTRAVLDGMVERQRGSVLSMSSDAGRIGEFRQGVYSACKGGIIALTKSVAREVGRFGIRVNVVCPGTTMPDSEEEAGESSMWRGDFGRWNTPEMRDRIAKLYPLRRIGRPEDIADTVVFLSSERAGFVTGQTLSVSGGYTMM